MHRTICLILVILFCNCGVAADSQQEFNYRNVVGIAVVKEGKYALFENSGIFIEFKDIISNSIARLEPISTPPQPSIAELFLVGIDGTSANVILGDHWLFDGTGITLLSTGEFATIMQFINVRTFDGDVSTLDDLTHEVNLAKYKDNAAVAPPETILNNRSSEATIRHETTTSKPLPTEPKATLDGTPESTGQTPPSMHSGSASSAALYSNQSSTFATTLATNPSVEPKAVHAATESASVDEATKVSATPIILIFIAALFIFLWWRKS